MLRPVEREKHQSAMIGRPEPLQNREVGQFQSSEECCQNIVQDILDETRALLDKANQSALNGAMTELFVKALAAYKVPEDPVASVEESKRFLVEFACRSNSELCNTAERYGLPFLRLHQEF